MKKQDYEYRDVRLRKPNIFIDDIERNYLELMKMLNDYELEQKKINNRIKKQQSANNVQNNNSILNKYTAKLPNQEHKVKKIEYQDYGDQYTQFNVKVTNTRNYGYYKQNSEDQNDISLVSNKPNISISQRSKYIRQNSLKNSQPNNNVHGNISRNININKNVEKNSKNSNKKNNDESISNNNELNVIIDKKKLLNSLSCKSYIVVRSTDNKILGSRKSSKELEIASLTKMMTLYVCLLVLEKLEKQAEGIYIRVSQRAADLSNNYR